MRVGFTGTQVGMTKAQRAAVRDLLRRWRPSEAHHGLCIGADAQFHEICWRRGVALVGHPPLDTAKMMSVDDADFVKLYAPRDYLTRNRAIVVGTDRMIAAPRGREVVRSGTWSTVRFARFRMRPLALVRPDGLVEVERWDLEEKCC